MPKLPFNTAIYGALRRKRVIDDSDCDEIPPRQPIVIPLPPMDGVVIDVPQLDRAPLLVVAAIAADTAAIPPQQMNRFFSQFPACGHGVLEPALPVAAADADVMDLRSALPPVYCQFLDMEAHHMPSYADDSGGMTGSDCGSDGSSFIDDAPITLTASDAAYLANFTSQQYPLTAAFLLRGSADDRVSAIGCYGSHTPAKRHRCQVVSSDSSYGSGSDAVSPIHLPVDQVDEFLAQHGA